MIVTGRNQSKLDAARRKLTTAHAIESDVSDPAAITDLYDHVAKRFPDLNMLINNAGIMRKINVHNFGSDLRDLTREIEINLNGPIRVTVQFLPLLKAQKAAAVVNVSSGLAFVPLAISPVYCATKAAIHSFTQSLRLQLKHTNVTVFELAPPITEKSLFQGDMRRSDVSVKPMTVSALVRRALDGIKHDRQEIRPGLANVLKIMSCVAPNFMVQQLGRPVDRMFGAPAIIVEECGPEYQFPFVYFCAASECDLSTSWTTDLEAAVRQFQCKERIGAPVHRVWTILADVEQWPQWTASVTQIEELNSRSLGLGSRVRIHQPKLRPTVWVVTTWEPESRFVWETEGPGVTLIGSHILKSCEEGCEVTLGLRFDGWLGGLAALLKGRIAERYVRCEAEGLKARS